MWYGRPHVSHNKPRIPIAKHTSNYHLKDFKRNRLSLALRASKNILTDVKVTRVRSPFETNICMANR